MDNKDTLVDRIHESYIESNRFNGTPATRICESTCKECEVEAEDKGEFDIERLLRAANPCKKQGVAHDQTLMILEELVRDGRIEVVADINPHIKRFPVADIEKQVKLLREHFDDVCLYPSRDVLLKSLGPTEMIDVPFTRMLRLGEAQLKPLYFDLEAVDIYAEDPRYSIQFHDFNGAIYLSDKYYDSMEVKPRDKTYLEHFGIGYKKSNGIRVAVVYVYDLHKLTPEHQQRWKTFLIDDEPCVMDEDYFRTSLEGNWPKSHSMYIGILEEIVQINRLCAVIGWPKLFLKDFRDQRPQYFRIPFRPTREAYLKTINELDKMLSQNMNTKFFSVVLKKHETYTIENHTASGLSAVKDLGSLRLLKDWITSRFKFANSEEEQRALSDLDGLFEIRKRRQDPAHKIAKNEHGIDFLKEHDRMVRAAFVGVRSIRLVLQNHPMVTKEAKSEIPDWLYEGNVRQYLGYKL